jgi:CubicO group peptidase (beta-lactamase class C family)
MPSPVLWAALINCLCHEGRLNLDYLIKMEYSNAGYAVAAAMAEATAGEAWDSLVESRLARPLGIRLTQGWPATGDSLQPWGHKPKSPLFGMATSQSALEPQAPGDGWARCCSRMKLAGWLADWERLMGKRKGDSV